MSSTKTTPRSSNRAWTTTLVVNNLVIAVDGWLECPGHPGQGLDRHFPHLRRFRAAKRREYTSTDTADQATAVIL